VVSTPATQAPDFWLSFFTSNGNCEFSNGQSMDSIVPLFASPGCHMTPGFDYMLVKTTAALPSKEFTLALTAYGKGSSCAPASIITFVRGMGLGN